MILSFALEGNRWRVAGTFDTSTLQQEFDRSSCKRSSLLYLSHFRQIFILFLSVLLSVYLSVCLSVCICLLLTAFILCSHTHVLYTYNIHMRTLLYRYTHTHTHTHTYIHTYIHTYRISFFLSFSLSFFLSICFSFSLSLSLSVFLYLFRFTVYRTFFIRSLCAICLLLQHLPSSFLHGFSLSPLYCVSLFFFLFIS